MTADPLTKINSFLNSIWYIWQKCNQLKRYVLLKVTPANCWSSLLQQSAAGFSALQFSNAQFVVAKCKVYMASLRRGSDCNHHISLLFKFLDGNL